MKAVNYPVILGNNFLTLIADKAYSITTSDGRWAKVLDAVKRKAWGEFFTLMDKPAAIARYSKGKVTVYNDEIHYDGKPVNGVIAERILKFMNDGFDFAPLVAFLDNLYLNDDEKIKSGLYHFLENNHLAITERGSFLAYKLVNEDGSPFYSSGTFLNEAGDDVRNYEVGQKFFFPREKIVKTDGECSTQGLYVGNRNYWNGQFDAENNYTGGGKMLIVEVYPQNVCNVPHADATKIVVCELKVVDEYKTIVKKVNGSLFCDGERSFENIIDECMSDFNNDTPAAPLSELWDDLVETNYQNNHAVRDSKGRFVKAKKVIFKRDAKGHFVSKKSPSRDAKGRFRS